MEKLYNYLPDDLVNIVEEYYDPKCEYCDAELYTLNWIIDNLEGKFFCDKSCVKWYRYYQTKNIRREKEGRSIRKDMLKSRGK